MIETPSTDEADAITDLWVSLARDQRVYGSHIVPEDNRSVVRDVVIRHTIADELLVASTDGDTIGFVLFTTETGTYEQDVKRGLVLDLYVASAHRNRGVGTALLDAAEERLTESGVDRISLDVLATNGEANRFYRRHGYEPHRVELEKSIENDTL